MGGLFRNGGNWLAAGLLAALLLPALIIMIKLPFIIAVVVTLVAFVGVGILLTPRQLFEGIDISKVGGGKIDLARKVLAEAMPEFERLNSAARAIRKPEVAKQIGHLTMTAKAIIDGVEEDPARLMNVQRFLTYYLPKAADIAESYPLLESKRIPDIERLAKAEDVLGRLDDAFAHYADSMTDTDLSSLDVELRLITSSISQDLGSKT